MRTWGRWHWNWLPVTRDIHRFAWKVTPWWKMYKLWVSSDWGNTCCHYSVTVYTSIDQRLLRSCKSILVISDKASVRHLFMSQWTQFHSISECCFHHCLYFTRKCPGSFLSTLLFSAPVRSFFCSIRCCEPLTSISSQCQSEIRRLLQSRVPSSSSSSYGVV